MGSQSNSGLAHDKKNIVFVVILAIAIIISILFWKTESASEKLESAQFKLFGLRDEVNNKIIELDSLHVENKLISEQYQSLKQNYLKLQKIIVAKKKKLDQISNVGNKKEMASLLDELNGHLLNYESISEELTATTHSAVNNGSNDEILAENRRIAEELRIAELNSQILTKEKRILNDKIKTLEDKLANFSESSQENNEYLASLKTKFETEQQRFNKLKTETDEILKDKELAIDSLTRSSSSIKSLSQTSFRAVYHFKEGRRAQKTILLNNNDLHKSKYVKDLDISFVVPAKRNDNAAKLSVLKKDANGTFTTYRYDKIDIPLNELKGDLNLAVEPKFDKGEYKFIVSYESEQVFNHEFVIQ